MRGRQSRQEANFPDGNSTSFKSPAASKRRPPRTDASNNCRLRRAAYAHSRRKSRFASINNYTENIDSRTGCTTFTPRKPARAMLWSVARESHDRPLGTLQPRPSRIPFRVSPADGIAKPVIPRMPAHRTRRRVRRITLFRFPALEPLHSRFRRNPGWRRAPSSPPTRRARSRAARPRHE